MISHNKQMYKSWKSDTNIKLYNKAKSIKNTYNNFNVNCPTSTENTCGSFVFKSRPLQHYRKSLDCNNCNYDIEYILNNNILSETIGGAYCAANLIIKPANTVINKDISYSASNHEYLYKKCKTFNQNLNRDNGNLISPQCECSNNIVYRNKNYYTNGPITSSDRISNLKYRNCANGTICNKDPPLYRQSYNENVLNCCNKDTLYQSRRYQRNKNPGGSNIRILK